MSLRSHLEQGDLNERNQTGTKLFFEILAFDSRNWKIICGHHAFPLTADQQRHYVSKLSQAVLAILTSISIAPN